MTKYIYLAGPIADCDKGQANDWRTFVSKHLPKGVVGVSPLRCEPLVGDTYGLVYDDPRFGSASAISAKNIYDTRNCDMLLAYMPKDMVEDRPSFGTTLELGWAMILNKPIILVSDYEPLVKHPLIASNVNWTFNNFDDAFDVIEGILEVYA